MAKAKQGKQAAVRTSRKPSVRPTPRKSGAPKARSAKPKPVKIKPGFKVIRKIAEMKKLMREARARGRRIALVPTMGCLHQGHETLIHEAGRLASLVVVSVFVNPLQFGPQEDLDRYPRDFSGDRRRIRAAGADVMFAPEAAEIYPEGFQTAVDVTEVTRDLCGATRSGHFRGVTTVVAKLLLVVQPDVVVFGEKDYQQLITVRRMVRDFNLETQVVGMPTVREPDGLAMSSRNTYLSPAQRQQALAIARGLTKAKRLCESGERDAAELAAVVVDILREQRDLEIEYVAVCHPETLERIQEVEREAIVLVAARVGDTRLIDNIRVGSGRR
jgi:pantoate--beta-alanine ligase